MTKKPSTIPQISNTIDEEGNLKCECPACSEKNLNELAKDLEKYANKNKSLRSAVGDFSKVHEVYASTDEFEKSRKRIKEGDLKAYFREKAGLKEDLKNNPSKLI